MIHPLDSIVVLPQGRRKSFPASQPVFFSGSFASSSCLCPALSFSSGVSESFIFATSSKLSSNEASSSSSLLSSLLRLFSNALAVCSPLPARTVSDHDRNAVPIQKKEGVRDFSESGH